jgi:plasmid stabilization system protein ParE
VILEFHPAAADELAAAVRIGDERSPGLGAALITEARRVAVLLCEMPDLGHHLDPRHRRFPLRRFPYGLIFRVDGDRLRVVALAHRRQEPNYWRDRR